MPPTPAHPYLSSDPVSGIPFYRHSENLPHSVVVTPQLPASTSAPIQVPGNMLGAKARAAEYNAAKAATARQQASKDIEAPPKPTPISLSAFTRNASFSRNKGTKSFVPLALSEEEERSASSLTTLEVGSDQNKSPSPPTGPVYPRPASLPPPQTMAANLQAYIDHSAQTPFRYRETPSHIVPVPTRSVYPDETYGYPQQALAMQQQYLHYPNGHQFMSHAMPPAPNVGISPFHETRPTLSHNMSAPLVFEAARGTPVKTPRSRREVTTPKPEIAGPTMYLFGPDDLSPAKCEIKQRAREKYFAEQEQIQKEAAKATARVVSTPPAREDEDFRRLIDSLQSQNRARAQPQRLPSTNLEDLLIDRNVVAPTRPGNNPTQPDTFPRFEDVAKYGSPRLRGGTAADWPYLGQRGSFHGKVAEKLITPTKTKHELGFPNTADVQSPSSESLPSPGENVCRVVRPPPGLEHVRAQPNCFQIDDTEQLTNIKFPLADVQSKGWLEIRMPTEAERETTRRVYQEVAAASDPYNERKPGDEQLGIQGRVMDEWLDMAGARIQRRTEAVDDLAKEMAQKWAYGGSFRSATMSSPEAQRNAAMVRAVTGIMSTLSLQTEDGDGLHDRGSRRYVVPPEYAVERSVGLDKGSHRISLFEPDGQGSRPAPARLARDPRFRPQLPVSIKLPADDERIPRMFVSARRDPARMS